MLLAAPQVSLMRIAQWRTGYTVLYCTLLYVQYRIVLRYYYDVVCRPDCGEEGVSCKGAFCP